MAGASVNVTIRFNRIPAIARALGTGSNAIVQKTAIDVQGDVIRSMEGGGHGRRYGGHIASAPGQPPARDLGTLANSIFVKSSFNRAVVGVNAKYGPHLEYGTSRMKARPFLRPAARRAQGAFTAAVRIMVERAAKG